MAKGRKTKAPNRVRRATKLRASTGAKRVPTFYSHPTAPSATVDDRLGRGLSRAVQSANTIAGLRRFLKENDTPDLEFQDGLHSNRIRAAQYELMRLEYLSGNVKAGDRLLAKLQDLDRE
jgi:hypothetical protein